MFALTGGTYNLVVRMGRISGLVVLESSCFLVVIVTHVPGSPICITHIVYQIAPLLVRMKEFHPASESKIRVNLGIRLVPNKVFIGRKV
jgi:hypothetical protein